MKEVAIVGFATPTRSYAPYDNPDIEIWSCNEGYQIDTDENGVCFLRDSKGKFRADRWFQIHNREIIEQNQTDPEHLQWLQSVKDMPIYTYPKQDDIPMSIEYPLQEIVDKYFGGKIQKGGNPIKLFSSSFDYMLALALYEGFDKAYIYGFDMAGSTEYYYQRPGAYLWLGIAISHDMKVEFCKESKFIISGLYGVEVNMIVDRNSIEIQANYLSSEEAVKIGQVNKAVALREQAEAELRDCRKNKKVDKAVIKYIEATNTEKQQLHEAAFVAGQNFFAQRLMDRMDMKYDFETN